MRTGLIAVLMALAGLAMAAGCSPKQTEVRADPRPPVSLAASEAKPAAAGAPPSLETPEADLAAARARMPTRCVKKSCPALEARWTPEIAPCVLNAATREDAANCYGRAAWRLDRTLERQF
ncbi:MAG: hypothetical protein JWR84_3564, partial [Caulobacter sp.]|nr:hypothetical protein [Caulobacter sp.]